MTGELAVRFGEDNTLARVEAACGTPAALALAHAFGGREIYLPKRPAAMPETHPLAIVLGLACARKVAEVIGYGRIIVPMGPTANRLRYRRAVRELKEAKRSNGEIAGALGIHLRTVCRIVAAEGLKQDEQPDLFGS